MSDGLIDPSRLRFAPLARQRTVTSTDVNRLVSIGAAKNVIAIWRAQPALGAPADFAARVRDLLRERLAPERFWL